MTSGNHADYKGKVVLTSASGLTSSTVRYSIPVPTSLSPKGSEAGGAAAVHAITSASGLLPLPAFVLSRLLALKSADVKTTGLVHVSTPRT